MTRPKTDEAVGPPANTTAGDVTDQAQEPPAIETIPRRPPEPADLPEVPEEPAAAEAETLERLPPAPLHLTLEAKGRVVAWAPKATDTGQVCRITFETSDIDGDDLDLLWSAQPFLAHMTLTFSGRSQRMPMEARAQEIDTGAPAAEPDASGEPLAEVRVSIGLGGSAFAQPGEGRQPEGYAVPPDETDQKAASDEP